MSDPFFDRRQLVIDEMEHEVREFRRKALGGFGSERIPEELWRAQQWQGQAFTPTPVEGKPLLKVQLEREMSRDWTIHLGATRMSPAPGQVAAITFLHEPGDTSQAIVRLNWGHHGSLDTCDMSWPSRGGSFTIHASYFDLTVIDPSPFNAFFTGATYNAWVDEGRRPDVGDRGVGPILSQRPGVIPVSSIAPAAGTSAVPIPRRARSVSFSFNTAASPAVLFQQEIELSRNTAGIVAQLRLDGFLATKPSDMGHVFPIPPWANVWAWVNTDPGQAVFEPMAHWFLDLG